VSELRLPRLERSLTFDSHNSGKMVYNLKTAAARMFEIELTSEERGVIGFVHIQSSDLYSKCKTVGKWENFVHFVTPTDMALGGLVGAKFRIKARKLDLPKDEINRRRNDARKNVAKVVEWISKFNQDRVHEGMHDCQISVNSPFYKAENLLQSAIYLEHLPLVKIVIEAGGKVGGKAISWALNLADDGDKLALNSDDKSNNEHIARRKTRQDIVEFLRKTMKQQNGQVSRANDTDNDNDDEQVASRPDEDEDKDDDIEQSISSLPHDSLQRISGEIETSHSPEPASDQGLPLFSPSAASSTLPDLAGDWLETKTTKKKDLCRFFRDKGGCKRGEDCNYVHVHGPFGVDLQEKWDELGSQSLPMSPSHFQDNLHVRDREDSAGRLWYTAGFSTAVGKYAFAQDVLYAEGGNSVQNEQGVHWYATIEEAIEALQRVCTFSAWANAQGARCACGSFGPRRASTSSSRSLVVDPLAGRCLKASPPSSRPIVDPLAGGCLKASPPSSRPVVHIAGVSPQDVIHQPGTWNNNGLENSLTLALPLCSQVSVPIHPSLSIMQSSNLHMPHPLTMPQVGELWLAPVPPDDLCRDFERKGSCPRGHGSKCTYLHLQQPWGAILDSNWPDVSDKSLPVSPESFSNRMIVLEKEDSTGRLWYTARFNNEAVRYKNGNRFIFYAEGGDSVPNAQSVQWYSTREAAVEALKRVYTFSFWAYCRGISSRPSCDSRGPSPSSSRPVVDPFACGFPIGSSPSSSASSSRPLANLAAFPVQHEMPQPGIWCNNSGPDQNDIRLHPSSSQSNIAIPPHLSIPHPFSMPEVPEGWLCPEQPERLCREFEKHGSCPRGTNCKFSHLQQAWGQVLETNWSDVSDKSLPGKKWHFEKHLKECQQQDSTGRLWYTACFDSASNKDRSKTYRYLFFAEGGDGAVPNEQGVHWYSTREAAVEALKRVYTFSFWAYPKRICPPCHKQQ
jgi:Zinc finger C-x8-C-x5-C-x3-H type (and similar)